ncbi:oligo-1,6-glucosidase [Gangjinia marincola]|uniref:Oligo-1,6-glucosidase n=1 Tax=Gangjinia marincola TaxID=578463 RepID=A0ABN1MI79_9FLAO
MKRTWWKESVIYQIYPRSFNDTTGNGIGDIPGIIQKLDYIKSLGVDVIWLCPVYESPNDDNGYDISDYRKISAEFGGQDAFNELLDKVHGYGMKLVMDLVANHSSDEHFWFTEAKKSKDNPYRDYYIWKDGKGDQPPNNWVSFFSGSAWKKDDTTNQYFLHLFTKKQPDLNWENPKVRQEIYDIIEFWSEKGVDGFRMDVISLISKLQDFPPLDTSDYGEIIRSYYANGPRIHEYLHEMNQKVLSKYDIMTVGEGPGIDLENGPLYVNEDREELNMVFHFDHMFIDNGPLGKYDPVAVNLPRFKKVFSDWDKRLHPKGWGSIFLGNHDFSRMVSRFGNDGEYRTQSAKLLAALLLTLRGTPYIYQGDEIGMTNVAFSTIDDYNDVETVNAWKEAEASGRDMKKFLNGVHRQSRDNARTPMQWDASAYAGFSDHKPWLQINPNYKSVNVAAAEDSVDSILQFYKEMISLRKEYSTLVYGDFKDLAPEHLQLFVYVRKDEAAEFLILHNFSEEEVTWPDMPKLDQYKLLKSNYASAEASKTLQPWQTKIFLKQRNS